MSTSLKLEELLKAPLKVAIDACIADPTLVHKPELSFLKGFVEQFGGKIPSPATEKRCKFEASANEAKPEPKQEPVPESEESDLELDTTGVIQPDTDAPQKMGNPTMQPTEDEIARSQEKRSEAVSAFAAKDYDKAIELYTEAIVLNPQASLLYAKRGQVYLMQQKPNACIRDCNQALVLNPDSAVAHKCRGRANQLLGNWEEAATDLRLACKFDFDEEADEWLREVTPNARKIEEHKRKKNRRAQEKLEREKKEKIKKVIEAAKMRQENTRTSQTNQGSGQTPKTDDFYKFINDSEVLEAFEDPEIGAAFVELSTNPASILKYQNNPKVVDFIVRMASKFADTGVLAPGLIPGMPGFPGTGATPNTDNRQSAPQPDDDVGLD